MNIHGRQVVLRAIGSEDVPRLHQWSNDPEVQAGLGGWHFPLSVDSLRAWVGTFRYDGTDQRFIIEASGAGPVGMISLTSINWKDRNAFHGVLIGERKHLRKGYAADAVATLMRFAFEELGLERLDTTIVEFNTASLALHRDRLGWSVEGIKKCAVFRTNRFWSNIVLGITRDEFVALSGQGRFDMFKANVAQPTSSR